MNTPTRIERILDTINNLKQEDKDLIAKRLKGNIKYIDELLTPIEYEKIYNTHAETETILNGLEEILKINSARDSLV